MLAAEEARASLTAVAVEDWLDPARRRVGRLQRRLRRLAEPLVTPAPDLWEAQAAQQRRDDLIAAACGLDELSDTHLRTVMEALHPELGSSLAAWWAAAGSQPYSRGWSRRAFRAPSDPVLTRPRRIDDLDRLVTGLGPFPRPPEWLAAWAPHLNVAAPLGPTAFELGPLLAAAIDAGGPSGEATFQVLLDSGNGTHPIGGMGRHVIVGLLRCSRPEGWAFIESMLLAAQRQEGLRQSILESADEAHPEAFSRIIDLVIEENLIRFAATIRAVAVWLGFPEDAEHLEDAERRLALLRSYRADRSLAAGRVLDGDAWDTYTGLCAIAQHDVGPALDLARRAIGLPDRHNRAAALRFLANSQLPAGTLLPIFAASTADPDPGVAAMAARAMPWFDPESTTVDVYGALDALARRLPVRVGSTDPVGIDPDPVPLDRGLVVARMVQIVGDRPLEPLLTYLPSMDPSTRAAVARAARDRGRLDGDVRAAVLAMVGDRSAQVRREAVETMNALVPDPADAPGLEALLTRKAGDLRRGVIGLLGRLPVPDALASARRLWDGAGPRRDAACELLSLIESGPAVVGTAGAFLDAGPSPTQAEVLTSIVGGGAQDDDPTLGLYHAADLTTPRRPRAGAKDRVFCDTAAVRIADALDDLAEANRNTPFELVNWQGSTEMLLADTCWLPSPFQPAPPTSDGGGWGMVLPQVFRTWWDGRPEECRGESDPLDVLRALAACELCTDHQGPVHVRESQAEVRNLLRPLVGEHRLQLRHPVAVEHVLHWLLAETADGAVIEECLDAVEAGLASVPRARVEQLAQISDDWQDRQRDWRPTFAGLCPWMQLANRLFLRDPLLMTADRVARWFGLMRWFDQPVVAAPRHRVDPALLHAAHAIGAASDADVYEAFTTPDRTGGWHDGRQLLEFTKRRRDQAVARHPTVVPLADRIRERVLEIERARGELSTPASHLAFRLGSIEGADVTLDLLARLGRSTLVRGYSWNNEGREAVYSRLIQISHPGPYDDPDTVAGLVARYRLTDRRLVDLAMFAPQWAPKVEAVLGWDGLEDAVWWFHTHTKDDRWSVETEVRETWAALSAERTPLSAADLTEGAVDVDWFGRANGRLGAERWDVLHKSAKLASGGAGHRRAQTFAEAMAGQLDEADVVGRITARRHQDSVRALGLLPLPDDGAAEVALTRYRVLREFERGSRKFGQQRQRSEGTAVRVGIENLARTTGAADPQRFVWAMEAAEASDLADGPVTVTVDGVTVSLSVDVEGTPDLAVQRGDRVLKAVPAKLGKQPEIKALTDRRTALRHQAARVRRSLEDAMVRQDSFGDDDFAALGRHPVVAPMLDLVVWVDGAGGSFRRSGAGWVDGQGGTAAPSGPVRIAHPVDLLGTGHWIDWQRQLFDDAQRQPFKQAFRELYVLTEAEAADSPLSRRWEGHQIQPRQAQALFTARGWLGDHESGEVARVHHHAGLVARLGFLDGWGTPAEVELPTIGTICFTRRGEHLALPLRDVPPVVFSETMRDLDLVVSVAHAGGVDPEATASTVDMRAALVREAARLLRLDNVTRESSHVVIEGSLGEYSVHLGSGTVHRRPGGALCIIPVDAQRRGRIFLPFADDDPKSAEVVSKVLMLARDTTIRDPTILEQLRS